MPLPLIHVRPMRRWRGAIGGAVKAPVRAANDNQRGRCPCRPQPPREGEGQAAPVLTISKRWTPFCLVMSPAWPCLRLGGTGISIRATGSVARTVSRSAGLQRGERLFLPAFQAGGGTQALASISCAINAALARMGEQNTQCTIGQIA